MVYGSEFISNNKMPMDIQVSADILEKKISFEPRGAPLSDKERKELNLEAGRLIKSLGLSICEGETTYDMLREEYGYVGYANYYVMSCWDEQELTNKAHVTIYKTFLEIDTKLGTTSTEQLFELVFGAVRLDLVMV